MNVYRKIVAIFYDLAMRKVEQLCLQGWRKELISNLSGDIIEIGAGTGVNLDHYPSGVNSLLLCEPEAAMRRRLERKLLGYPHLLATVSPCPAERLDAGDASADHLVATLVFCSVADPHLAMREAYRVLRPGGRLILMEHVAASSSRRLFFWQSFWQPLWKRFACNCHLTRQTGLLLVEVGFIPVLRQEIMRGAPAIAAPMIVGYAIRP